MDTRQPPVERFDDLRRTPRTNTPRAAVAETASALLRTLHINQLAVAASLLPRTHPESIAARVFRDLEEMIMAIGDLIDRHNENPKPFIWTAKASDILEKSEARPQIPEFCSNLFDALQ